MSNMNGDTKSSLFYTEMLQDWLKQFGNDIMEQKVVNSDMKLRHIVVKGIEVKRL